VRRVNTTLSVPVSGTSVSIKKWDHESGDKSALAVDYDNMTELVLRDQNISTDRGLLADPDPAAVSDFRWLTINDVPLTDSATLKCNVGSDPCRMNISAGVVRNTGGFMAELGDLSVPRSDRAKFHVFYTDLRTRTYAFSRREGDKTEYWLSHEGIAEELGTEMDVPTMTYNSFVGSRYGYEGDFRNQALDILETRFVTRKNTVEEFGLWPKINPILGFYDTDVRAPYQISMPPTLLGIEVAVDGSVLVSGQLPKGTTFNYHSEG